MMQFDPAMMEALCTADFLRRAAVSDPGALLMDEFRQTDAKDLLDATLSVDVNRYLPDALLVKVDVATMANSLEGRSPLLDHEFMEFAARLPVAMKRRGPVGKYIFKKAVRPLLPVEIVDRPKKGFSVPLEQWFRTDLKDMVRDTLLDRRATDRGYFNPSVVRRLIDEHQAGVRRWDVQLWNLLMLELWHRMFIDRRPSAPPPRPAAMAEQQAMAH
jgi:asparagine synthase (glutamine-hydrolysing)